MSIHSLVACDRCPATLRLHHSVPARSTALVHHNWVSVTYPDGRTEDLCAECGRDV